MLAARSWPGSTRRSTPPWDCTVTRRSRHRRDATGTYAYSKPSTAVRTPAVRSRGQRHRYTRRHLTATPRAPWPVRDLEPTGLTPGLTNRTRPTSRRNWRRASPSASHTVANDVSGNRVHRRQVFRSRTRPLPLRQTRSPRAEVLHHRPTAGIGITSTHVLTITGYLLSSAGGASGDGPSNAWRGWYANHTGPGQWRRNPTARDGAAVPVGSTTPLVIRPRSSSRARWSTWRTLPRHRTPDGQRW